MTTSAAIVLHEWSNHEVAAGYGGAAFWWRPPKVRYSKSRHYGTGGWFCYGRPRVIAAIDPHRRGTQHVMPLPVPTSTDWRARANAAEAECERLRESVRHAEAERRFDNARTHAAIRDRDRTVSQANAFAGAARNYVEQFRSEERAQYYNEKHAHERTRKTLADALRDLAEMRARHGGTL